MILDGMSEPAPNAVFDSPGSIQSLISLIVAEPSVRTAFVELSRWITAMTPPSEPRQFSMSIPGNLPALNSNAQVGSTVTLETVTQAYRQKLKNDVVTREISQSYSNRLTHSLSAMLRHVTATLPLQEFGYEQVASIVTAFKDRSTNHYAPDTVANCVGDLRIFLRWLSDTGQWRADFDIGRLCRVRKHKLLTLEESRLLSLGKPVFTPGELARLYRCATQTQRLYLLLGLTWLRHSSRSLIFLYPIFG